MNHSNCGPNCSYRRLYEGVQGSLADMAANHASQAKRTRRLREGLIAVLRATAPKRFGAIERHMEMRLSEVDDETLLAAAQAIMEPVRDEKALSDLRVALSEAGFGWAASTSPADLIDTVRRNPVATSYSNSAPAGVTPPLSEGFVLPPGILPSMLPGVTATRILEAKRAGRLQDLLQQAYREYARANGLPEDPTPAQEPTPAPAPAPAPVETREYVDPNLDGLFTDENKTVAESEEATSQKKPAGGRPAKSRKKTRAQAVDPADSLSALALDDTPEEAPVVEETPEPKEEQISSEDAVDTQNPEDVQEEASAEEASGEAEEVNPQDFADMFSDAEEAEKETFDLTTENFSDEFGSDVVEDFDDFGDFEALGNQPQEDATDTVETVEPLETELSEAEAPSEEPELEDRAVEEEKPVAAEDDNALTDLDVKSDSEEEAVVVEIGTEEDSTAETEATVEAEEEAEVPAAEVDLVTTDAADAPGLDADEAPATEPAPEAQQEQLAMPVVPAARNVRSPSSVYQFSKKPPRREPTAPISKELKEARRRAISPDTPEAAASAEVDADVAATFEAYATLDRPTFVSDLADITGDASIVDAWVDAIRAEDEPRFKAMATKKRYNSRGALIIPTGPSRELMANNADTTWFSVLERFQGAALVETAVFLHDFRDEVQTWKYSPNNHAVFTRLSSNGQMTGVILAYGENFVDEEVCFEVVNMVEESFGDRLSMVAVLAVTGPAFDALSDLLTRTAAERNWNPASTVVVGRAYEWVSGGGDMTQLF